VGLRRFCRQFSFPGGVPSHVAAETPGSIHEGGELGYSLTHAFGAAFDNPRLTIFCVVGDGEAETGPLAASWRSKKFLNPATVCRLRGRSGLTRYRSWASTTPPIFRYSKPGCEATGRRSFSPRKDICGRRSPTWPRKANGG